MLGMLRAIYVGTGEEHTLDLDRAGFESHIARGQHVGVVFRNHRNNRHTGLDGEMESTLLERQQLGVVGVTPSTLGKDKDALALGAHLFRSGVECLDGRLAVGAINENRSRKSHEPAEEGDIAEGLLGRDTAVRREDVSQHQHVQFGLVVSNEHGRTGGQMFLALHNVKLHAGGKPHHPLEAARGGPLRNPSVAHQPQDNRRDHAICSTEEKRSV